MKLIYVCIATLFLNEPYPEGEVELLGINEVIGDPVIMWTIFLEEGQLPVTLLGI